VGAWRKMCAMVFILCVLSMKYPETIIKITAVREYAAQNYATR
jgi:hypothetical protein